MFQPLVPYLAVLAPGLVPGLAPGAFPEEPGPVSEPPVEYETVTNSRRSVTNFNIETIRGMAFEAARSRLYAINTHGSFLLWFGQPAVPPAITPASGRFRTVNNPVSLALWDDASNRHFAIVVGGGTHGVVKQDRDTGEVVDYLELPSEPKDIVIDEQNGLAYVACAGAFDDPLTPMVPRSGGVVMRIKLDTFAFDGGMPAGSGVHFIDAMRPTFLNIEMGPVGGDNLVYVTPFLSGNQSTFMNAPGAAGEDLQVGTATALPDDDLFRIDEGGTVKPVLSGAGTLLTAHGRHPITQDYWILNVDSLNAQQHTEPMHRGRFAENRVSIASQVAGGGMSLVSSVPLDKVTPSLPPLGGVVADKPVSFPFGLALYGNGMAAVVGSTGDTVRLLDGTNPSGNVTELRNIALPDGSIPRSILLSPNDLRLWVYAWGTNRILEFDATAILSGATTSVTPAVFDLGVDPLPAAAKEGRRIWYDADNSFDPFGQVAGKVSCNTCHPAGGMDMLGWDLGDPPVDRKDTMVTQSLLSIEDTFPYHWRGERSLSDFNGAFKFLLGGDKLDAPQLAEFESFVFSLQGSANPRQHRNRILDDTKHIVRFGGKVGSASRGQQVYLHEPNVLNVFKPATCVDCHSAETGSSGLITPDNISFVGSNFNLDVSHLRQLQHKFFQPVVQTSLGARPRGGFGLSQDGNDLDIDSFFDAGFFLFSPTPAQSRADAASFVVQFDQGIAPRAHWGAIFNQGSLADDLTEAGDMYAQAMSGNCDLAAIGHWMNGSTPVVPIALWYDRASDLFFTAETNLGFSVDFAGLDGLRSQGIVQLLLVGLPLGNGFRFAVDHDDDGLSNTREATFSQLGFGTLDPMNADTDGDTYPDGYELDHFNTSTGTGSNPAMTTSDAAMAAADTFPPAIVSGFTEDFIDGRQAKFLVEFSEPVSYEVQVLRRSGAAGTFLPEGPPQSRPSQRRLDTLMAHHLVPSIDFPVAGGSAVRDDEYRFEVTMTDPVGNTATQVLPSPTTSLRSRDAVFVEGVPPPALVTKSLSLNPPVGGRTVTLTVDIDDVWEGAALGTQPMPAFAGGITVVAQLLVETSPGSEEYMHPGPGVTIIPLAQTRRETVLNFALPGSTTAVGASYGAGSLVDGEFLLADADNAGVASLSYTVTGLPPGTNVRINLIGTYDELTVGVSPPLFATLSPIFWQLPMTPPELRGKNYSL